MFNSMSKHIPSPSHRSNILSTAPLSVRSQTSVLTRPPEPPLEPLLYEPERAAVQIGEKQIVTPACAFDRHRASEPAGGSGDKYVHDLASLWMHSLR